LELLDSHLHAQLNHFRLQAVEEIITNQTAAALELLAKNQNVHHYISKPPGLRVSS
jgi:hypothetical protein